MIFGKQRKKNVDAPDFQSVSHFFLITRPGIHCIPVIKSDPGCNFRRAYGVFGLLLHS